MGLGEAFPIYQDNPLSQSIRSRFKHGEVMNGREMDLKRVIFDNPESFSKVPILAIARDSASEKGTSRETSPRPECGAQPYNPINDSSSR